MQDKTVRASDNFVKAFVDEFVDNEDNKEKKHEEIPGTDKA